MKDVLIDFRTGKVICALHKGTLEVFLIVKFDWRQAKIIKDQA